MTTIATATPIDAPITAARRLVRAVVESKVGPKEAVKAYHDGLKKADIKPTLPLAKDRVIPRQPTRVD